MFISTFIITASNTFSRSLLFMKIVYEQNLVYRPLTTSSEGPWAWAGPMGPGAWAHGTGTLDPWDRDLGPMGPGPWAHGTGTLGPWDWDLGSMGPGPWAHGTGTLGPWDRDLGPWSLGCLQPGRLAGALTGMGAYSPGAYSPGAYN